jgi:molybdate/tungstate transport system substrate-binding protein
MAFFASTRLRTVFRPGRSLCGLASLTLLLSVVAVGVDAAGAAEASAPASGPVDVLSAGSLQDLMQQVVGPDFTKATGYTVNGFSGGSDALASEIRGKTEVGDVFISASPSVNASLEGPANGAWVSWYAGFATSPLVLAYNPLSRFAAALKSKPWFDVVRQPGFLLGRTDPATDPKGALAVEALDEAAGAHHLPALRSLATSSANVFPETSLVGELQAGQLDAGFFYGVEAASAHLKTVPLRGTDLSAHYTITVLHNAPHAAAARAFLAFLLGAAGRSILKRNGLMPTVPPTVSGKRAVPHDLAHIV